MIDKALRFTPLFAGVLIVMIVLAVLAFSGRGLAFAPGIPGVQGYEHPTKNPEAQKADLEECRDKASTMHHARRARGMSQLDFRESDYFDECMRDRGYSPKNP